MRYTAVKIKSAQLAFKIVEINPLNYKRKDINFLKFPFFWTRVNRNFASHIHRWQDVIRLVKINLVTEGKVLVRLTIY